MVSRVILHIGLHKTGTSSLQKAFRDHRDLLRQHGIAYPIPKGTVQRGQHRLGKAVARKEPEEISNCWTALEPLLGPCDTVLLSAESLSSAQERRIATFKTLLETRLGSPDFTIYVGIRRWSDRLVSFWHKRIRSGSIDSLPDFVQQHCSGEPVGHFLDFTLPIERWVSVFGRPAMKVRPVERLTEGGRDLVGETFRDLLGIEAGFLNGLYRANQSLPWQTELIRAVSRYHRHRGKAMSSGVVARAILEGLKRNKDKDAVVVECAALLERRMMDFALDDRHPLFLALEAAALARFGDLVGQGPDGGIFPIRPPRTWPYVPDEVFDEPEIRSRVEILHAKAVRRVKEKESENRAAGGRTQATLLMLPSWLSQILKLRLRKT